MSAYQDWSSARLQEIKDFLSREYMRGHFRPMEGVPFMQCVLLNVTGAEHCISHNVYMYIPYICSIHTHHNYYKYIYVIYIYIYIFHISSRLIDERLTPTNSCSVERKPVSHAI